MTVDACDAGLSVEEIELPLRHRATARDAAGFAHRARQQTSCAQGSPAIRTPSTAKSLRSTPPVFVR